MDRTIRESLRAPGLPSYPPSIHIRDGGRIGKTRYLPVFSINYDSLPMSLDSPKTLWVDLGSPAPFDLLVGMPAKFHLTPFRGIRTTPNVKDPLNSVFEITDVIGSRVILSPYKGSAWLPTVHASCDNPFGWGYDMKSINVSTNMHGVKYGYGAPVSYLEYQPVYYSNRATQLESVQLEEDYYRGASESPSWYY